MVYAQDTWKEGGGRRETSSGSLGGVLEAGGGGSPFVEGCGALPGHHLQHTVQGAAVLAWGRVHVPGLHHIHWGGHHRGTEAGSKGGDEVAG